MDYDTTTIRKLGHQPNMTTSKNEDRLAARQTSVRQSAQLKASQTGIAKELRRYFDEVVNEPVPDNFIDLLRRLDDEDKDQK